MNTKDVTVVLCEDYVGMNPIKEHLIRDGKVISIQKLRPVPELLNIGARIISVHQAGDRYTLFYLGWI